MIRVRFLYIFLGGVVLFIFGAIYGVFFVFPYPDLPAEEVDIYLFHSLVSFGSLHAGIALVLVSIVGGIVRVASKLLVTTFSKAISGLALVISGYFYGYYIALPLPGPPPKGIPWWVVDGFVSVTMILAGLILLLLVFFKNLQISKALKRKIR